MASGIKIKGNFKIKQRKDGRLIVAPDHAAALAKLDVSTRKNKVKSKKVRVTRRVG
jgi:hypothetical protein